MDKIFDCKSMASLIAEEIAAQGFSFEEPIDKSAQKGHINLEIFHYCRPLPFARKERKHLARLKAEECDAFACSLLSITGNQGDKEEIEKIANRLIERFGFYQANIILRYDGPKTAPIEKESIFKVCALA
jgi:hypothetical protein